MRRVECCFGVGTVSLTRYRASNWPSRIEFVALQQIFYPGDSKLWRLGHLTGHPRCKELKGCFCLELIRAVNQFCWFDQGITGGPYKRLNLETKRFEIALSSTTWPVTWSSIFGESHIWWGLDQSKERTAKPWTCFVNDSSVTVGLDCVLKFYLNGRLDCDGENVVSSAPLHVCMSVYSGNLEC